jgi:WD40 repeat protein
MTSAFIPDLESGRLLQRSLLPQSLPTYAGMDIAAEMWTAVDLGGDYYQFLEQPGTFAVAIADSSGKSVAGAIHAALFKGQLDAYAQQGRLQNPTSVLSSLNQLLCKSSTEDAIALAYGALDLQTYEFALGNAGMPGPYFYRAASQSVQEIVNPSMALGRYDVLTYRTLKQPFHEGDIAFFFSDGLFEAASPDGREFGRADETGSVPLKEAILSLAHLSALEIILGLKSAVDAFTARIVPEDDISIVVIKLRHKTHLSQTSDCPYQEALQAWLRSEEQDTSALLRGARLFEALKWAESQPTLPKIEQEFLQASQVIHEREQLIASRAADADRLEQLSQELEHSLESERQQRQIAEMGEINERIIAQTISSEALYHSNNHIEALIAGVIGGVQLKRLTTTVNEQLLVNLKANTQIRATTALEQVVYGIHEYNRLEGHGFWVNRVRYSPDGSLIATASSDRTIKIWQSTGKLLQTLIGHNNWVTSIAFSPDGTLLVSGSRDNTAKIWIRDPQTGAFGETPTQVLRGHEGPVLDVCFSPDGQLIATASEDVTVRLWKINGASIRALRGGHERWVQCVAFHPNGKAILSGSADRTMILWNTQGVPVKTYKGHESFVESVSFSPNGQTFLSASRDRTIRLWDISGSPIKTFSGHSDKVWSVVFGDDGHTFVSSGWDRTIRFWDIEHGLVKTFGGHGDVVHDVALSPDGKTIASASRDTTVKLWNIRGTPLRILTGHTDEITAVAVSPNARFLASSCRDKTINLWNANGTLAGVLAGHNDRVNAVVFSPDSQTLLSVGGDCSVKMWNTQGVLLEDIAAHRAEVMNVVYRCDGQVFATCSADTTIRIWSAEGKWLQTLTGHTAEVYSVAYSPDGSLLVSASKDKTVKLWSWEGTLLANLDGHSAEVNCVAFSADGQFFASGSIDQSVKIWRTDGTLVKTLNGHSAEVTSVVFSPDGTALVSAGEDATIQFWSVDGTLLRTFNGHTAPVRCVTFSPDGRTLISAGDDQRVIMWNLDLENLLMRGCQWLQEYLRTNQNVSEEDKRTCLSGCGWLYKHLKSAAGTPT